MATSSSSLSSSSSSSMPHLEIQVYNFDSQYTYKFTTLL
jgi:hypothetical protein